MSSNEADRAEGLALALFLVAPIVVAIVGGMRGELPDESIPPLYAQGGAP